jgi:hypothetical protein
MNFIPAVNPFSTDSGYGAADGRSCNAARVSQTAVAGEQSADITIMTDQNDRVTLSFDAGFQSSYTTYSGLAANNNGYAEIEGRHLAFDISLEQSISVEGDLNEQEVKDIKKVLQRLGRIMQQFLTGSLDDVAQKAGKLLKNMATIDRVDARVEFSKSAMVLDKQYVEATALSPREPEYKIQPLPLPPEFSSEFKPIHELTDGMVDLVERSQVHPAKMMRGVAGLFHHLFGDIARGGPLNVDKMNLARLIQSDFIEKLKELFAPVVKGSVSSPSD